ncbi:hypothetical protein [Holophaga foetida]|uniref:hypothetical protein n=1 Tax=Holophaga foetida TaxID=35839 RepID=UPI0002472A5F|nr:hypothetical protein [Holophaga foetida]
MRIPLSIALILALGLPAQAASKPKPAPASVKQLQNQVKQLSQERDELKDRLAALDSLQQEAAGARKSRDLAREESSTLRRELDQLKASMAENQHGLDNILGDLKKAKAETATVQDENADLRKRLAEAEVRLQGRTGDGAPVVLSSGITPARVMNLGRQTPSVRRARGVVVVNVLVSEAGDAMEVRLLQGLSGEGEWIQKANEACLDAAKRLVFDPARAADGKTPVKVWQGVGFYLE